MYELVIYDLDGTLINSLDDLADCMNTALQEVGLMPYETERYKYFVGQGVNNLVKDTVAEQSKNTAIEQRVKQFFDKEYAEKCMNKTKAYNGILEMLIAVENAGVKLAVLTNKPDQFINTIAEKLFAKVRFSALWGKKPQYNIKPDPQSLNALISSMGIQKNHCLYVGDSDVDVYTAQNAGVDFCGAAWGFRGTEELKIAGATNVANTPKQLMEFILK